MPKYAFSHPGKIGDALYSLPTINAICERDGAKGDFYTSIACLALERLMQYQKNIEKVIIPPITEYRIESFGQGVQPWRMPIDETEYDKVIHLGFRSVPNGAIHKFIAEQTGMPRDAVDDPHYDYPEMTFYEEPYIVVVFNWARGASLVESYTYLIDNCPIKVVQTGLSEDLLDCPSENQMGLDLLEVASLLSKATAYVGCYSGILALANGFPDLPKFVTIPHTGAGEQHGLHLCNSKDLLTPTPEQLLGEVKNAITRRGA
jgi:hypothetical protein